MSIALTKTHVQTIAKLDFGDLGYLKRIDMVAKALGYRNQATLMSALGEPQQVEKPVAVTETMEPSISELLKKAPELGLAAFPEWIRALETKGVFIVAGPEESPVMSMGAATQEHLMKWSGDQHHDRMRLEDDDDLSKAVRSAESTGMTLITMQADSVLDVLFQLNGAGYGFERLQKHIRGILVVHPRDRLHLGREASECAVFDGALIRVGSRKRRTISDVMASDGVIFWDLPEARPDEDVDQGPKIVSASQVKFSLDELRLPDGEKWKNILARDGLFIVAGRSGDGRSTTLMASAAHVQNTRGVPIAVTSFRGGDGGSLRYLMNGHDVVLMDMHAPSVSHALRKLVAEGMSISDIGACLRGVLWQKLIRSPDGIEVVTECFLFNGSADVQSFLEGSAG